MTNHQIMTFFNDFEFFYIIIDTFVLSCIEYCKLRIKSFEKKLNLLFCLKIKKNQNKKRS